MKKKKVKPKQEKEKPIPSQPAKNKDEPQQERFDFGGLREGDLKKNLGCG